MRTCTLLALSIGLAACGGPDAPDDSGPTADGTDATDGTTGDGDGDGDGGDGADGSAGALSLGLPDMVSSAGHPLESSCDVQMPVEFECFQPNPTVTWAGAPDGTVAYVLVFDDPDAGDYPHWAIVNIPAAEGGLDAGISGEAITNTPPDGAYELDNGFGWSGYLGSCPPAPHTYRWRLWAVSEALPEGLGSFAEVAAAADAVALAQASACHVYGPRASR